MKRVYIKYVFVLLLGFLGGATLAGVYMVSRGIGTHEEPTRAEAFVARSLRHFAISRGAECPESNRGESSSIDWGNGPFRRPLRVMPWK